jgi:hypothetical protein
MYNDESNPIITNSILWGNTGGEITNILGGSPVVTYSIVQSGYAGTGNLNLNPLLDSLANNGGITQTMALGSSSPAIDTGDDVNCPATDQRGMTRPQGSHCDMGAYEYRHVIHYVKSNAGGANNGISWANAYTGLQSALSASLFGDETWVAAGTYKPTTTTDRTISFTLQSGVAVYGGFAGKETLRTQRNPSTNVTTLSGEIGAAGVGDNSYHVVMGESANGVAVLDGFTVVSGNANGTDPNGFDFVGGGIVNFGFLNIENSIISNNSAVDNGGGIENSGTLNIVTSTVSNNSSVMGGAF